MFKSIFTKYLSAFALIICISFLMLSSIIATIVNGYAADVRVQDISWALQVSKSSMKLLYENCDEEAFLEAIKQEKNVVTMVLDAYHNTGGTSLEVFITDVGGKVVSTCSNMRGLLGKVVSEEEREKIYASDIKSDTTNLGGVLEEKYYVGGVPIKNHNGEMLGSIFICSSPGSAASLINVMTRTIIMSSLWIMLAAMIAVYFISDRMVSPLRSMISAAKQFGKGKFENRVEIRSNDEIGELAVAFNQMAESLGRLETMRNTFLANVSHDLRTPMTTIAGFIDSINSGAIPPEEHAHYLNIVSSEVHRLSRLVGQLLDIARLESGARVLQPNDFDVCELSRLILISFEQKIEQKRLNVEFDVEHDSMSAFADKDAIHQVVYNLCDNAIKFAAEEGILRIRINQTSSSQLTVSVYNTGEGISKEDLPYVFERFYKTDKSRGLDKSGAGLGLHIVKTIIEAHEQTISVDSVYGQWCEFSFTLKRGRNELPADIVQF